MLSIIPYLASVVLTKGLAFLVIPIATRYLGPADYGRLEVVASLLEFTGLVLGLGLADTLFRFAGSATQESLKERAAAEIVGTGLTLAIVLGIAIQLTLPAIREVLPVSVGVIALRFSLVAATLSGVIELPLAWMRFRRRPFRFATFVILSGVLQIVLMTVVLVRGGGVEGVLIGNATVNISLAGLLVILQIQETGIAFRRQAFVRAARYGMPLVGGGLAMFGLGACDRWFLAAHVEPTEIAHYALASKLGLAAALAMQPFGLWWYAQRIEVLKQEQGIERSSRMVGMGIAGLVIACSFVSLAAPIFVAAALPKSYEAAIHLIPFVVVIVALNELCSLTNVGCYCREHGVWVMAVNGAGAIVAIVGYIVLIPTHGVFGAIAATLLGQSVRLVLFQIVGNSVVKLRYPLAKLSIILLLALIAVQFAPLPSATTFRLVWTCVATLILVLAALVLGLWHMPVFARLAPQEPIRSLLGAAER
jgi:O-antigen/teichoic acid export membrane protein